MYGTNVVSIQFLYDVRVPAIYFSDGLSPVFGVCFGRLPTQPAIYLSPPPLDAAVDRTTDTAVHGLTAVGGIQLPCSTDAYKEIV